ncbi:protein-tyrosine phosphatase-like protein [Gongronella butleri]|nr:protein-tyrosine phosphatase-like protein [Gongronella butleri]
MRDENVKQAAEDDDSVPHSIENHEHLFERLPDSGGKQGGILMRSKAQEVLPNIWLGGFTAMSGQFIKKNKIRRVLSIGHFHKNEIDQDVVEHKIIPIADMAKANIMKHFDETNAFIQVAQDANEAVLVHCMAGVSRSATVVTAYLMQRDRLRFREALARIKRERPFINPNEGFLHQLRLYEAMNYTVDDKHPKYMDYIKHNPHDMAHFGHTEYESTNETQ